MQEKEQSAENREGEIIEPFDWNGEPSAVRFAKRSDKDGLAVIDIDRAKFRLEEYKIEDYKEKLEKSEVGLEVKQNFEKSLDAQNNMTYIVLQVGEEIVGYVEFWPEPDAIKIGTISTLQMQEKYCRQGFGTKLLNQTINQAKNIYGAKRIELSTHNWNYPARDFYKKNGFVEVGDSVPEIEDKPRMALDKKTGEKIISEKIKMVKKL
jgi:ribosomal protein S18 acetylase RimI-like enzyme